VTDQHRGYEFERDIQAPGWLTAVHDMKLPPQHDPRWHQLLATELEASKESPAAGTHLLAFARTAAAQS